MPSTDQPIQHYIADHTTLDIIVKEDIAGQMSPVSPDHSHFFLDPFSRLIVAVAWNIQAAQSSLSTNDFPKEGS